jgi:hypothetical protein
VAAAPTFAGQRAAVGALVNVYNSERRDIDSARQAA